MHGGYRPGYASGRSSCPIRADRVGTVALLHDRGRAGPFRGDLAAGGGIGMLVLVVLGLFFGVDPSVILSGGGADAPARPAERRTGPPAADPVRDLTASWGRPPPRI